jgi:hypothetical protein
MIRTTLADAKDPSSGIQTVLGICPADARFTGYVNRAQKALLDRGRWCGTIVREQLCVSNGCLTWPRHIATIEMVDVCKAPVPMHNQWWEFMGNSAGLQPSDCSCSLRMVDRGMAVTFADISGTNKKLRLYYTEATDIGKTILVQGYDENNVFIRTVIGGVMSDGFEMTLADPFVESTFTVSRITGIQKPLTDGLVRLFQVDSDSGDQLPLGVYEPTETKPWYRRSYLSNLPTACGSCGCSDKQVNVIVKLEYIPARVDTDYLIIPNLEAIRTMIQSMKKREDNLELESLALEKAAIRELNHELRTHTGDRISINVPIFGDGRIDNRHAFNIG